MRLKPPKTLIVSLLLLAMCSLLLQLFLVSRWSSSHNGGDTYLQFHFARLGEFGLGVGNQDLHGQVSRRVLERGARETVVERERGEGEGHGGGWSDDAREEGERNGRGSKEQKEVGRERSMMEEKMSLVHRTLEDLLLTYAEEFPVKVELNCNTQKVSEYSSTVCIEESKVLSELASQGLKVSEMTTTQLREVLFKHLYDTVVKAKALERTQKKNSAPSPSSEIEAKPQVHGETDKGNHQDQFSDKAQGAAAVAKDSNEAPGYGKAALEEKSNAQVENVALKEGGKESLVLRRDEEEEEMDQNELDAHYEHDSSYNSQEQEKQPQPQQQQEEKQDHANSINLDSMLDKQDTILPDDTDLRARRRPYVSQYHQALNMDRRLSFQKSQDSRISSNSDHFPRAIKPVKKNVPAGNVEELRSFYQQKKGLSDNHYHNVHPPIPGRAMIDNDYHVSLDKVTRQDKLFKKLEPPAEYLNLHRLKGGVSQDDSYDGRLFQKNGDRDSFKDPRENPFVPPDNPFASKETPAMSSKKTASRYPLAEDLYKLKGQQVYQVESLDERGFDPGFGFDTGSLVEKRKVVEEVVGGIQEGPAKKAANSSLDTNLISRGKFQRYRTKEFCALNQISPTLPSRIKDLDNLFKHLLYDDSRKIVFCYVPKNGCSNLKRMMLILNGFLPTNASLDPHNRPSEDLLGSVRSLRDVEDKDEALHKLKTYYKFAVIRNPLERLLSAYKNKLENPFDIKFRKKFPDRLKAYIMNLYDRKRLMNWVSAKDYDKDIHPSFMHFLKFMSRFTLTSYNEHFMPFLQLCYPCSIDYDVLINFKTINYDVYGVMEHLGVPTSYYPTAVAHESTPTSSYMEEYYSKVPTEVKSPLFKKFAQEMAFYYSVHPEERGMHRKL